MSSLYDELDPQAEAAANAEGWSMKPRIQAPDAATLRQWLHVWVTEKARMKGMVSDAQVKYLNTLLSKMFDAGDPGTVARHQFLEYVFGVRSSKLLTKAQASVLIDWAKHKHHKGPDPIALREACMVLEAWGEEHGQLPLMTEEERQDKINSIYGEE